MAKEMNSNQIAKLIKKIARAREMHKKLINSSDDQALQNFYLKLKEISDKTDLAYNDVIVKKAKLRDASERMQMLEKQLDELLTEISEFQSSELEKKLK
jgi:hypothetical protein